MPIKLTAAFLLLFCITGFRAGKAWESRFVKTAADGTLSYVPDEKGNILPDFSRVGYFSGDRKLPSVPVVRTLVATGDNSEALIQAAINELSTRKPDAQGFRGAILLRKGTYRIPGTLRIEASGIVLRGEGMETKLVASGTKQRALILATGKGSIRELPHTRTKITDAFVAVGSHSFTVASTKEYTVGDRIIVYRPGTKEWVHDLKMDQIVERPGTKQWQPEEYNFQFERTITGIEGNRIFIDNPIVMEMEARYGAPEVYKYSFEERISQVGIENLYCESEFLTDTSENHGWDAIHFDKLENGWVRGVTARYFGYSCVNLDDDARNVTVTDCNCFDAKSVITGGRRYSFNNTGQMNLFTNCHTTKGRHDYVTGARVRGPNVFYNCTARNTHADIGPHHRWAMGTLYDNIVTDGEINVQDRGNMGSGHGWVGVTQILWNCTAKRAAVQSPYVNGKNYCIGLKGGKAPGHFPDRPDGVWEGQNQEGLQPASLYQAQLQARRAKK